MSRIPPINIDEAPAAAKPVLEAVGKKLGMVPNLFRTLGRTAPAVEAYAQLDALFGKTTFTAIERQVVLLATSFENQCAYCLAAHSMVAELAKADPAVIGALRTGAKLPDTRLSALAEFTRAVVRQRGQITDADFAAFQAAGYTPEHALEVVVGIAMKTVSNYTDHIAEVPLDAAFERWAWVPTDEAAAQ